MIRLSIVVLVIVWLPSISLAQSRPFQMGFSTWPNDISERAVNNVYNRILREGDIVLEQLEEGVPWNESLQGEPFPTLYQAQLESKVRRLSDTNIILAVNPLDNSRTKLAQYRTDSLNQPLPEPWVNYDFDNPNVKRAYFNYCRRLISLFKPKFFIVGIEVNILMRESPEKWQSYLRLHKYVYTNLKRLYPKLPILVSLEAVSLLEGFNQANHVLQQRALNEVLRYSDLFGISLHPFMSGYTTGPYPFDIFKKLKSLSTKPIAITESSFPAEEFSLLVSGTRITFRGSPSGQRDFYSKLLNAAARDKYKFVTVFSVRDYDAIWEKLGQTDQLLVWRDTGFIDETGKPRAVLNLWRQFYLRPYRPTSCNPISSYSNNC